MRSIPAVIDSYYREDISYMSFMSTAEKSAYAFTKLDRCPVLTLILDK